MTSSRTASVTAEIVSWEISTRIAVAIWCWMSLIVIPPAYKLTIMSSTSVKRLEPFRGRIIGENVHQPDPSGHQRLLAHHLESTVFGYDPLR